MLRRTTPAVSFTVSHRALMFKTNRPLLGHEMNSVERFNAGWNEMPFFMSNMGGKELGTYMWRAMFELGFRDWHFLTKWQYIRTYMMLFNGIFLLSAAGIPMYYCVSQVLPESCQDMAYQRKKAQAWGQDVHCADGKFCKPAFHIAPPMLTCTVDDL